MTEPLSAETPLSDTEILQMERWAQEHHDGTLFTLTHLNLQRIVRLIQAAAVLAQNAEGHPDACCANCSATIDALTKERDKAETTLEIVKAHCDGWGWLAEGRGMYTYDDGRYDDDVRLFVGQLLELLPSGNWFGMPEWLAKYEQLAEENRALRAALDKYGVHGPDCVSFVPTVIRECKCGLSEALARRTEEAS